MQELGIRCQKIFLMQGLHQPRIDLHRQHALGSTTKSARQNAKAGPHLDDMIAFFDTRQSGQLVDVSMYEPILQLLSGAFAGWDGEAEAPGRMGSRVAGGVPRNVYRTGDGRFVVVSGTTDAQVARMLQLIGRDTEADRARFGASRERLQHADELDGLVAAWIAERSRPEVIEALDGQRIPVAPVNDPRDVLDDEHVAARGSLARFEDAALGTVHLVAPSPQLSGTPGRIHGLGPPIGAHNREVYREWAGLGDAEFDALEARGVI